jgi:PAS domain S-box-containing protein
VQNPIRPLFRPGRGRGGPLADWLRAELEVHRVLGEARGLAEAAPKLFGVIGPGLRMDMGVLWLIEHRTGALRSAYVWRGRGAHAAGFEAAVRRSALASGEGLAGAAWARMLPLWRAAKPERPERSGDRDPVGDAAREDGLRVGLAFPIHVGPEFHGVVELVARKGRRDTEAMTIAAQVLGETLGQFLVRQGALQRLGAGERRLAELFANAPLGLLVADAKGRILQANQAELEMLGYARDAYVGRNVVEFYVDPAAPADLLARVGRGEEVRGFEARMRRGDGAERWVRIHANGSFEDGRLLQVRCFSRDVTQEKEAERTLRESEERFRLLVEGARDYALHTYDAAGRVSAWSLGAQNLFGWTEAEATELGIPALFGPEDRADDVPSRMLHLAEDEGRFLHEGWLVRKDGSRFWAHVSLTAVRDPLDRVTHVCQLTRDATESRRVEVLRRKGAELESANNAVLLAQRRTAEMLEGLRSSIEAPVLAIERLVAQLESGSTEEAIRTARASATALRRALDRASTQGAMGAASGGVPGSPVDLFRLASEVRDMLRDAAAERRIRVEVDVEADLGQVLLAPDRLRQVLFNLVSNAIRFNRDRGRVSVRFLREGDVAFRLEVEDTGVGMPEDRVASLFDAKPSEPPAGGEAAKVGLPATRRVVLDLGGRITARSALGRGSVFSVILPKTPASAPASTAPSFEAPALTGSAPSRRVIVVETDPAVRASLGWTLGGAGYDVASLATVAEAIESAGERRCDVLAAALDREEAAFADVVSAVRSGGASRNVAQLVALVHLEDGPPGAVLVSDAVVRPAAADRLFAAVERAGVPRGRKRAVLLVDGDVPALEASARTLEALGYRVVAEPDADAALRAAADEPPAAVIVSPFPLVLDVFQFLHHLRRIPDLREVPVILCTPRVLDAAQVAALRASAGVPEARLGEVLAELDRRFVVPDQVSAASSPRG